MVEIERILCPVDLSEFSHHAWDHARALTHWYGAEITVLHVFTVPLPLTPAAGMAEAYPPLPRPNVRDLAEEVRRFCGLGDREPEARGDVVVTEGIPAQ